MTSKKSLPKYNKRARSPQFHIDVESMLWLPDNLSFFWKDLDSYYQGANDPTAEALKFKSRHDIKGKTDFDLSIVPKEALIIQNEDKQIIKNKLPAQFSHTVTTHENIVITLDSFKGPLFDKEGNIAGVYGINKIVNKQDLNASLRMLLDAGESYHTISQALTQPKLTKRQKECLTMLLKGMTMKQIAKALHLSPKTVEHYLEAVKKKWNCHSRIELIIKATRLLAD